MAFDGTLKFDTNIDKSGFEGGISKLGSIAKTGMAAVTGAITAAKGAIVALGKKAVEVGSGFESSMAQVIATMGVTKETVEDGVNSYELLKKAAAEAGESTTFSASEAAGALNYLALAGYSAAQAADALPSVLNLAAAGGLDLKYASDLVTDAMAALGIEATKENLTHFGDQMAKTASKANTSVAQLGEAILTVGGTAKSLAGGTTELNAALGVLANRGIKGSEGGTALRNMILSLSAPTDKAAGQLEALGVEVFDATGKMRPLNDVFKDLDKSLSKMTEGEKTQVLNTIFNKVDLKSAQALLAGCGDEFDALTAALASCDGAMSDMAQTMNDTLEGDMKSLGSKAEALGITVFDSLNTPLRDLAQLGGQYISQLTGALKYGGFGSAAYALGTALGDAVTQLTGYIPTLADLGVKVLSALVKGIISNAPALTDAALSTGMTLIEGIASITGDLLTLGAELLLSLAEGIIENLPSLLETAQTIITDLTDAFVTNLPLIISAGIDIITALADALSDNIDPIISSALTVITVLCNALFSGSNLKKLLDAGMKLLMSLSKAIIDNLPALIDSAVQILVFFCTELLAPDNITKLIEAAVGILTALFDALIDNIDLLIDAALQLILGLANGLIAAIPLLIEKAPVIIEKLVTALVDNLPMIIDAAIQLIGALAKAILENLHPILQAAVQIVFALIKGIVAAAPDLLMMIPQLIGELLAAIISSLPELYEGGVELVQSLIEGIVQMLGSLADAGIKLVTKFWDTLMNNAGKLLSAGKELFSQVKEGVMQKFDDAKQWGKDLIDNLVSGIKEKIGAVGEAAKGIANRIKSFLHFSVPDEGPLTDLPNWMPDMVSSLSKGITQNLWRVEDAVSKLSGVMVPTVDIDMPDVPARPRTPTVGAGALDTFRTLSTQGMTGMMQPSPTSSVINNSYTYNNTTTNTPASGPAQPAPVNVYARIEMDGDVIAEKLVDRVDTAQGESVTFDERGTAH